MGVACSLIVVVWAQALQTRPQWQMDASQPMPPWMVSNVGHAVQGLQGMGAWVPLVGAGKPAKEGATSNGAVPVRMVPLIAFGQTAFFGSCASCLGGTGLVAHPGARAHTFTA